jgi:protein-S-isoprenylcysteine O-methyltransferase Ste14
LDESTRKKVRKKRVERGMPNEEANIARDPRSSWTIVLVAVQIACLVYLAVTGPLAASSRSLLALQLASLLLALWAIALIRPRNVNVAPVVKPGARLVTRGPYRLVRHPMYTALLLLTAVWVANAYSHQRLAAWALLFADMVTKIVVEERYLKDAFETYDEYRRKTWRLIPFVF